MVYGGFLGRAAAANSMAMAKVLAKYLESAAVQDVPTVVSGSVRCRNCVTPHSRMTGSIIPQVSLIARSNFKQVLTLDDVDGPPAFAPNTWT